jgi:hypothetical protein
MFLRMSSADKHKPSPSPPMSPTSKAEMDKYDQAISSHMKEWKDEDSKIVKIGVLGTEGSGRLTFVTHMRLAAQAANGDHKVEQEARLSNAEMYNEVIQNIVISTKTILAKAEDSIENESAVKIRDLSSPVAKAQFAEVKTWAQETFQDEKSNSKLEELKWSCFDEYNSLKYWLPKLDSLTEEYKFEGKERVMTHAYKIRREHTGFVDYAFSVKGQKLDFSYPHQVKFKKWLPMFLSSVSCVLFFVDMGRICGSGEADYLAESVQIYEKTLQNFPKGTPVQIFLILSKFDVFEKFVTDGISSSTSLTNAGYSGSLESASEIATFVVDQFKAPMSKYGSANLQKLTLKNLDEVSVLDLMEKISSGLHK